MIRGDVNSHRGCSDGQLTAGIRGQLEIGLCVSCFLNFSPADWTRCRHPQNTWRVRAQRGNSRLLGVCKTPSCWLLKRPREQLGLSLSVRSFNPWLEAKCSPFIVKFPAQLVLNLIWIHRAGAFEGLSELLVPVKPVTNPVWPIAMGRFIGFWFFVLLCFF